MYISLNRSKILVVVSGMLMCIFLFASTAGAITLSNEVKRQGKPRSVTATYQDVINAPVNGSDSNTRDVLIMQVPSYVEILSAYIDVTSPFTDTLSPTSPGGNLFVYANGQATSSITGESLVGLGTNAYDNRNSQVLVFNHPVDLTFQVGANVNPGDISNLNNGVVDNIC